MNVYEVVTEQIIKQLESGMLPWRKPWNTAAPCNLVSQKEYRGINTFMLSASGFPSRYWLTYAQAAKLGGHVKQGEHGSIVVFWNVGEEKLNPKTGKLSKPFLLRYYRVFNLAQTEGIAHKLGIAEASAKPVPDIAACESVVAGYAQCASNQAIGSRMVSAKYRRSRYPVQDRVPFQRSLLRNPVPRIDAQHGPFQPHRSGRHNETAFLRVRKSIRKEELVAEMGCAYLCGFTGIAPSRFGKLCGLSAVVDFGTKGDSKLLVTAAQPSAESSRLHPWRIGQRPKQRNRTRK